ncbi:cell division protein CrgA [Nonomuraea cavernae]|uniref:cell division protein CrgA n=1 Tax=Nonomuraea cavernae TaxID=2045107 RepID=UPI0033D68A1F
MSDSYPREGTPNITTWRSRGLARWPAWAMAASWIVGILWIVMFYVDPTMPVLHEFGNRNLLVGFGFLLLGMVFALILLVTSARRRP